ncbi:MAG TPA: NADH-quinone oxidoreductase subunit K [Candidatus Omnitrophota bacterium]|nr:NADH-quinone oxidoreductase subunit K [Candidatus Omnitrophota bacterium]HPS20870.1 NADH-quinone oxidoreductase subunit K [Candidatus Omnitrophota bacterium]
MTTDITQLIWIFMIFITLFLISGFYCMVMSFNLIRTLIGLEILIKVATLFIVLAGHVTGNTALAQALVVTLIVIEVVVMVVAGGLVLCIYRSNRTINANELVNRKG